MKTKTIKRYYHLCQQKSTKAIRRRQYELYEKAMKDLRRYLHQLTAFGLVAGKHEIQDELLRVVDIMNRLKY